MALGEIVVAVVEADLPPRTLERNGLGPYVPRSVRTRISPAVHTGLLECSPMELCSCQWSFVVFGTFVWACLLFCCLQTEARDLA